MLIEIDGLHLEEPLQKKNPISVASLFGQMVEEGDADGWDRDWEWKGKGIINRVTRFSWAEGRI